MICMYMCFKHVYYSAHLITCYESNGIFYNPSKISNEVSKNLWSYMDACGET